MGADIRVLHVDDDPDFAAVTAACLEQADRRLAVETVGTAQAAVDYVGTTAVDCIVSDYDMPEMNGVELLDAIRDEHPDLPFILFTGKGSEEVASEAISRGATDYLQKDGGTEQYDLLANRITNYVEQTRTRRERERHLDAIETAKDGISIVDADGRFQYVNEAFEDLYGYEAEEVIGEHWSITFGEEGADRVRDEVMPVVEETGSWQGQTRGYRADGSQFIRDHSLASTAGGGYVCTIRDVSDQAEQTRKVERYERLVENLPVGVLRTTLDGEFVDANEALLSMIGAESAAALDDVTVSDLSVDPEQRAELVDRAQSAGIVEGFVLELVTLDGDRLVTEVTVTLVDEEGEQYLDGVLRDITQRRRREEALGNLQEATREFIEAPDAETVAERAVETARLALDQPINAVWLYDEATDALEPAAITSEGGELIPDPPVYTGGESLSWEVFEAGELRVYDDVRTATERQNQSTPIRSEIIVPLGDYGVMNLGCTEVAEFSDIDVSLARLLGNTVEAALAQADREAELRAQQAELQRQNERLEDFASVVSHDLQNPLQVATTYLELAQDECDCEYLDNVAQAQSRMTALIDDLLTLAREGQQVTDPDAVYLDAAVEDCWGSVATPDADLVLTTDRTVRGDEPRLKRLLENLVSNAVEHGTTHSSSDGPGNSDGDRPAGDTDTSVTVTVGDLGDGDGFYVADDGPGIPADERGEIFEHGYSTSEQGTGFGLAIVEEIVEAHGWDIRVTESADGGARFEVTGLDSQPELDP